MIDFETLMGEDKSVLQWGGLGGLLSGVFVILALITLTIVINLVPSASVEEGRIDPPFPHAVGKK